MTDQRRVKKNNSIVLKYCKDIKNPKVIEFGGGRNRLRLSFKVDELDYIKLEKNDIIADLEKKLPIKDSSYDIIFSSSVFEHIENTKQLFNECHRILKPKGKLIVFVPHFSSLGAFHFLHKRFFSAMSFTMLTEDNADFNYEFKDRMWKIANLRITSPIGILEPLINLNQRIYEGTILKNIILPRYIFAVLEKVV